MQIILQRVLAALDYSTLQALANEVSKEFKNTKVSVGSSHTQSDAETFFQSDFDRNRNQWNSPSLALEHFQMNHQDYRVVISDYKMAPMTGIELLGKMKDINDSKLVNIYYKSTTVLNIYCICGKN